MVKENKKIKNFDRIDRIYRINNDKGKTDKKGKITTEARLSAAGREERKHGEKNIHKITRDLSR